MLARQCSKNFISIISLNPHNIPVVQRRKQKQSPSSHGQKVKVMNFKPKQADSGSHAAPLSAAGRLQKPSD